jgi:hypothetical protein
VPRVHVAGVGQNVAHSAGHLRCNDHIRHWRSRADLLADVGAHVARHRGNADVIDPDGGQITVEAPAGIFATVSSTAPESRRAITFSIA